MCINTIGSYKCDCNFGNIPLNDNHSCYGNVALITSGSHQYRGPILSYYIDIFSIIDPCSRYIPLDDTSRSIYSDDKSQILSDERVVNNTWYRFNTANNKMMITNPIEMLRCGTVSPGWLTNSHPQSSAIILCKNFLFSSISSI